MTASSIASHQSISIERDEHVKMRMQSAALLCSRVNLGCDMSGDRSALDGRKVRGRFEIGLARDGLHFER